MDDDFELEVTDLDTGEPIRHPLVHNAPAEPGRDEDNEDNDSDNDNDDGDAPTPGPSRPRRSGRNNRLRTIMVAGIVLLAVALVIATNPAANSSLYTVFHLPTPVPSPTPLPGGDIVYLERAAPWGSVTIDGKRSASANPGTAISWIKLARGRHTIAVTQAPFPELHCTISAPARKSDTCPLFSPLDNEGEQLGAFPGGARFIDLGARFSLLPRDAQDALVAAVNAELTQPSAPVTLSPGDHYLRDDGALAVADTTLQATFVPTVLLPAPEVSSDSSSCISFCDISGAALGGNATWNIMVSMLGSWHIATREGQVVTESAPMTMSDPLYEGFSGSMQITISLLWTGRWQASAQNGFGGVWSPTCGTAETMASANLGKNQVSILGMNMQDGRTAEQGCVVEITPNDPNASGPTDLLYRVGVLLAANDIAHRTFPSLPSASSAERVAARRLLTQTYSP